MAFDPELATQAYMATLKGAARAKSDAYFEGGYWLILAEFLVTLVANLIVLRLGWAARLSRWARSKAGPLLAAFLFAVPYLLLITIITAPYVLYTDFFREHAYGLSNQGFAEWGGEQLIFIAVDTLLAAILWMGVHAAIRRFPRNWWLGGAGLTIGVMMVTITLAPVYLDPLFNGYTPLPDGPVKTEVLKLARANGVPADNVYLVDASRQSDRISANVKGLFGTTRIALNDNLMKQDIHEIRSVMAHELGHYVLNHMWKLIITVALLIAVSLALVAVGTPWLLARFGGRWGDRGHGRSRRAAGADHRDQPCVFSGHADHQHYDPRAGTGSRCFRPKCRPRARWLCPHCDEAVAISQDRTLAVRRGNLL